MLLENERLIQITKKENVKDADETTTVLRIDTEKALVRAWGYIQEPEKTLIWRYRWRNEVQLNDIWIPCEMSVEAYQDQPAYSMRLFPERSMLGPVDPEGFQFPLNATYQKLELARKQRADIQRAKNWVITVIDTISKSVTYYVICGILVFLGMLYLWRQKVKKKKNTIIENPSLSKD